MGKQRNTILILGEGPTEFFYFKSLCNELKKAFPLVITIFSA